MHMLNAVFYTAITFGRIIENISFILLFKAAWKQKEVLPAQKVTSSVEN